MFGPMGARRLMGIREQAASAPTRDVTRQEFIDAMVANGATPERAEFHAKIAEGLGGSYVLVGNENLRIVADGGTGEVEA